ncbi:MAG: DUF4160 domain-containing protein [Sedimentisphaerales bacterium]|nr:DUF4160 domain-containing protein [Sedimentisphaerales bacterium]
MSPTVFRYKNYRFLFFSREELKPHIHVASPDGEAKFWLTPKVELVKSVGFSEKQITELKKVIKAHKNEIEIAWKKHFSD